MEQVLIHLITETGRSHTMIDALRSLGHSLFSEPGVVHWSVLVDPRDPCRIFYVEEWEDAAQLRRSLCTSRFRDLLSLMEGSTRPPIIQFRTFSQIRALDLVEEVRRKESGTPSKTPESSV